MSRAHRTPDLMQMVRRYWRPVPGSVLAEELGVFLRTLYRDVGTLKAQGAHIEGEAGVSYVLRPGFMLPLLVLSEEGDRGLGAQLSVVIGSAWWWPGAAGCVLMALVFAATQGPPSQVLS